MYKINHISGYLGSHHLGQEATCGQVHKIVTSLFIACWEQSKGGYHFLCHAVVVMFVRLHVFTKLELATLLQISSSASDNFLGLIVSYTPSQSGMAFKQETSAFAILMTRQSGILWNRSVLFVA